MIMLDEPAATSQPTKHFVGPVFANQSECTLLVSACLISLSPTTSKVKEAFHVLQILPPTPRGPKGPRLTSSSSRLGVQSLSPLPMTDLQI